MGSPLATYATADWVGAIAFLVASTVVDAVCFGAGYHSTDVGLFYVWCGIEGAFLVLAGAFQGFRHRRWWEVLFVAASAAVLLALVVLVIADSDPGPGCTASSPCDTSYGLGVVLIVILATPLFAGVACLGRVLVRPVSAWRAR